MPLFLDIARAQCNGDQQRLRAILEGVRALQDAPRAAPRGQAAIVARAGRTVLRDYGGAGPPLIFVPSLINPPTILDLIKGHSLIEWMVGQGFHVMLVDWGTPDFSECATSIGGHVTQFLVPLIATLDEPPLLVGYCLGGTMAMAAAALIPVRALALIATPWNFDGFRAAARADQARLWAAARASAQQLGLMPMEALQAGFWQLDPARTVGKYAGFDQLDPDGDKAARFVAVEDWANDGPPLTYAAAREAFEDFFEANITGRGGWIVGGKTINPATLTCPTLDIISTVDNIVPAASASGLPNRLILALGHVGMIVGSKAPERLWRPLAGFMTM